MRGEGVESVGRTRLMRRVGSWSMRAGSSIRTHHHRLHPPVNLPLAAGCLRRSKSVGLSRLNSMSARRTRSPFPPACGLESEGSLRFRQRAQVQPSRNAYSRRLPIRSSPRPPFRNNPSALRAAARMPFAFPSTFDQGIDLEVIAIARPAHLQTAPAALQVWEFLRTGPRHPMSPLASVL